MIDISRGFLNGGTGRTEIDPKFLGAHFRVLHLPATTSAVDCLLPSMGMYNWLSNDSPRLDLTIAKLEDLTSFMQLRHTPGRFN